MNEVHQAFGDHINEIIVSAQNSLFGFSRNAQLAFSAFDIAIRWVQDQPESDLDLAYPVGMRADGSLMMSTIKESKEGIEKAYQDLAFFNLPLIALHEMVIIIESMQATLMGAVVRKYPNKLNKKRQIDLGTVLTCGSIEEIHIAAITKLLNELAYKSPTEFAGAFRDLTDIDIASMPPFPKYVEMKATRDMYVHNQGVANEVYVAKAGLEVRMPAGQILPVTGQYYLQKYEECLKLTEYLESAFHDKWPSQAYEIRKKEQKKPAPSQ